MDSYFRNCKHCGLGIFQNGFSPIDFFCEDCWFELEKQKTSPQFIIYKNSEIPIKPLFLWKDKENVVGSLIHGLKGGTPFQIIEKLSLEMLNRHSPDLNSIVVPVPSSKVGEKDHAFMMAQIISQELDLQLWNGLEWKNKGTKQKFLSKTERFVSQMVKKEILPRANKIILIDDLVTTGATAMAAHKAIKSLNQFEVWSLACRI